VTDILIVKDGKAVPRGQIGEIWIRGPNIMKEYWRDPGVQCILRFFFFSFLMGFIAATEKVVTKDGWLLSGDIGLQDEEGFLYIRDRSECISTQGTCILIVSQSKT
jgi:acyl-CoA synthetase (AMP-forming)/AMP-acid ligase II